EMLQQAGSLLGEQAAEGALAGGTVEQQDTRRVSRSGFDGEFFRGWQVEQLGIDIRQVGVHGIHSWGSRVSDSALLIHRRACAPACRASARGAVRPDAA